MQADFISPCAFNSMQFHLNLILNIKPSVNTLHLTARLRNENQKIKRVLIFQTKTLLKSVLFY